MLELAINAVAVAEKNNKNVSACAYAARARANSGALGVGLTDDVRPRAILDLVAKRAREIPLRLGRLLVGLRDPRREVPHLVQADEQPRERRERPVQRRAVDNRLQWEVRATLGLLRRRGRGRARRRRR